MRPSVGDAILDISLIFHSLCMDNIDYLEAKLNALDKPPALYGNVKLRVYPSGYISGCMSYEDIFRDKKYTSSDMLKKVKRKENCNFVRLGNFIITYLFPKSRKYFPGNI